MRHLYFVAVVFCVQNFLSYSRTKAYDQNQNFGMISLIDSLSIHSKNEFSTKVVDRRIIHNGMKHTYTFKIDHRSCNNNIDFSAALVWVEPPAIPGCMACTLNDLDLRASVGRKIYYPNGLRVKDSINNSERIRINSRTGNTVVLSVIGHNIVTPSQKYSLVVTGCFNR